MLGRHYGPDTSQLLLGFELSREAKCMTHEKLVMRAVAWLRGYGCGVVLSEQSCVSGETPDAIGWKRACHSVVVECKVTRADFLADREKPFRRKPQIGMGCERYYLTSAELLKPDELPAGWGLLELRGKEVQRVLPAHEKMRSARRVEVRIEPQSITDFLKWKNRMAEYNRGSLPEGIVSVSEEGNRFLVPATEGD
jgi:hypothetical protein